MFKNKLIIASLILLTVFALVLTGCGPADEPAEEPADLEEPADMEEPADVEEPAEADAVEGSISAITGIDPGAGIMAATEEAIEVYDLNVGLLESSDAAMTAELDAAIANEEWIIVTGWSPHWKFAAFDLKYLKDPEEVYGGEEYIATIARQGLEEDHPAVFELLQNFSWTDDEIGEVMDMNTQNSDFVANADQWIADNSDLVDSWTPEGLEGNGETIDILLVEWDCALASTNVIAAILRDAGFEVNMTPVDGGVMWSSIAEGDADFMTTAWLPGTHASYIDQFGDDVVEVATNYEGARIGLVVPSYVPFDSITDINDYVD
ncbi:glycine betaine ABC transporter substrate-binding protein [Tindallia californiensis]|uniref:Glycine betaine/proline transport system substrate-binding protein n=1 Tax=Tindallia californiensis TaxID=159292 RepID=A0A1H3LKP5_9FIRM|nr:glycine betaine ABC transporter substrate-binding protein [Tindallia californiensis]SDY64870.1 glycine betaine/proline transport system substrate-binding protein [Tindallia californiensis]